MTNVLLSLPAPLNEWAEEQAANNNFGNVGDYVESLLSKEQKRQQGLAEFDRLIQEGIDSGISDLSMDEVLAESRRQARDRLNAKL